MIAAEILIAVLAALAGWLVFRRLRRSKVAISAGAARAPSPGSAPAPTVPVPGTAAAGQPAMAGMQTEASMLETASDAMAQRLWRLAFVAPTVAPPLVRAHARVRDLIYAVLQVDELDPNYFPRRPTLMPQLMQAVNDPNTASDKLSRMIAHDPVLTADVLRLANSSLYRTSPAPIESIQRAIVVCGVDALRGILATAMLRPVFRASRTNFPRLPRMLWERTERAARAAELYAAKMHPEDRFEAQLLVLLRALGPLVVYSAALDGYSRAPRLTPNPTLFVELVCSLAPQMSQRIARDWETSPRLVAALTKASGESLAGALHVGELLGTLSLLESQAVISSVERLDIVKSAGLPADLTEGIWTRLAGGARAPNEAAES
jgi:HD-like signal output (HDOD) protein